MKKIIICMLLTFAVLIFPLSANANIWKKARCLFTGDHCHKQKVSQESSGSAEVDSSGGGNTGSIEDHGSGSGDSRSILEVTQSGNGNDMPIENTNSKGDTCLYKGTCGENNNDPISVSVTEPSGLTILGSGFLCFVLAYFLGKRKNITH